MTKCETPTWESESELERYVYESEERESEREVKSKWMCVREKEEERERECFHEYLSIPSSFAVLKDTLSNANAETEIWHHSKGLLSEILNSLFIFSLQSQNKL